MWLETRLLAALPCVTPWPTLTLTVTPSGIMCTRYLLPAGVLFYLKRNTTDPFWNSFGYSGAEACARGCG